MFIIIIIVREAGQLSQGLPATSPIRLRLKLNTSVFF